MRDCHIGEMPYNNYMWTLVIILLMPSNTVSVVTSEYGRGYVSKYTCQAAATDTKKIEQIGLHVLSAECVRVKNV